MNRRAPADEARAIATGASGLRAVVTADRALLYDPSGSLTAAHQHGGGVSVSFDPDGRRLAIASDGEVALYCLFDRSGAGRDIRFPCATAPRRIAWAPDGARFAAAPETPAVPCWYLDDERSERPVSYFGRAFTVAWSHDGRHLVGAGDGALLCWNTDRRLRPANLVRPARFGADVRLPRDRPRLPPGPRLGCRRL